MRILHRNCARLEVILLCQLRNLDSAVVTHQKISLALRQCRKQPVMIDLPSCVKPSRGECVRWIDIKDRLNIGPVLFDQVKPVALYECESVLHSIDFTDAAR